MVPGFLHRAGAMVPSGTRGRKLVVIQLAGGNDGLNCVIPYRNDHYYSNRRAIALSDKNLIPLADGLAMNDKLEGLAELYDAGHLSIINGVGYPNPNHSHFRSMDIWQSASDADRYVPTGWVGRMLDANCESHLCQPHHAVEIDGTLSLALKGERVKGMAFRDPRTLRISTRVPLISRIADRYQPNPEDHSYLEFLYKTVAETSQSAAYILEKSKVHSSKKEYPPHDFGRRMKQVAELIVSGSETPVYYVSLPGFDTHVLQKGPHGRLLKTYGDTLRVFCDDLKENGRLDETLVMTFSEFGRRLKQNAGKGTDHGTANCLFIAGGSLKKAGVYNDVPDLAIADNADLQHTVDFRSVYATILSRWLGADDEKILGRRFEMLDIV